MTCVVKNDGLIGERKGVNMPNVNISLPAITERDRQDILFGLTENIDYIAASFIRDGESVRGIRELCRENGGEHVTIFPKIECALGVENFDEILEASDGIMVARGDLGIEIKPELVPHIQKEIIAKCNAAYKPVITATQMLDSMQQNPRPTRAEVADVANAIYDGTDASCFPASPLPVSTRSRPSRCRPALLSRPRSTSRLTLRSRFRLTLTASALSTTLWVCPL